MKKQYIFILLLATHLIMGQTPTGNSTEVGITEGQLSVSLSGGANYSIPIAVPPGINGVVPQVGLVYNSQGGNGVAGYGWNISGVSAITRTPQTKFHNDNIGVINYNLSDNYSFDGQRLMVKNGGTYGASGTEYETENFSNVKITSIGALSSNTDIGPDYFIVDYPDGSKAYYGYMIGNNSNSRSQNEYAITYWENPQGVRINYFYATDIFKKIRLIAIKYGSTYDNSPINEVSFIYKNRLNPETQYLSGLSIIDDKILSEIKVFGNGYGFSNYKFTYDISSLGYERLTGITQKSGDGIKEINPTVFTYIENQTTYNPAIETLNTIPTFESYNLNSYPPSVGDFDGDGELEFLVNSNEGLKINKILDDNSLVNIANQNTILLTSPSNAVTVTSLDSNFRISNKQNLCTYDYIPSSTEVNFKVFKFDSNNIELDYQRIIKYKDNLTSEYGLGIFSGDFNGDKLTDFVFLHSEQEGGNNTIKFLNLDRRLTSNSSSDAGIIDIGTSTFTLTPNVSNGLATITGKSIMKAGDINGDGKTDLILFRGSPYNDIQVYSLINGNFETIFNWNYNLPGDIGSDFFQSHSVYNTTVLGTGKQRYPIVIGDYNGDGKSDIFFAATGKILISTGKTFIEEIVSNSYSAIDSQKEVFLALDYNNDGKSDILRIKPTIKQFTDGMTSTVWYDSSGQIQVCCPVQNYRYEYGINIQFYFKSNSWLSYNFEQNNGYDFSKTFLPLFTKKNKINPLKTDLVILGGQSNTSGNNLRYTASFLSNNNILSKQNLIKSITTGNGVKETITYAPLINGNGVYTASGPIENYPNIDIVNASGFQVVSKIEKQSSLVYKKQLFAYYGAVSNTEGLGFLGFRSTVRTNWHDDSNPIISTISKFDIEQRGANVENYTVLGWHDPLTSTGKQKPIKIVKEGTYTITGSENLVATQSIVLKPNSWIQAGSTFTAKIDPNANVSPNTPTDYITKSIQTYESELLSNKVFKIKNVLSKQHNKLENTNSETTTTYDTYNNPKQITTLLKEGASVVQTTITTLGYDDQPSGTTYYIGRPTSKTQSVTASGDSTTSDEVYEYTNNLLTKVKKNSNNSGYIVEDNEYDTFGNITKKTITVPAVGANPALAPRVTNYEYNPAFPYNGRFLTKSKDIQVLATQYDYNPNNGVLNSVTNPYNLTTSYLYDSWFKKIQTTDYLGKKNIYQYFQLGVLTVITTTGDDGSFSSERFDDIGRKIQTYAYGINGNVDTSEVKYSYDIYDRKVKVFEPNNTSQWSETKYDEYGRVKENISYTGKTVTANYSGLTSTVIDGTKTKTYTKNAMGNVVSMTDAPGGIINYTYFANGNLKTTNYDGVVTTIEQDNWGRKSKLTDPSAGEYKYTYNGFGETTSETTPNGITTYNLDDFGRLSTKTISGNKTNSKTTYNYNSTSKLLDSSVFEDLQAGTTTTNTYFYDTSKRLYKTVESTPSYATFTREVVTFDSFGRVEKETSTASINGNSSAKTIKNTYKNGYPWQILEDVTQKVLWQTNTVNARGQLLTAELGNGIAITNAYDEFGYITQFKHDKAGTNPDNIMTLNTTFDRIKGNLKTRNDINLFGWSEDFTNRYDYQDRLTSYKKNAQGDIDTQSYDDRGRITKNGVGTYSYLNNGKAYQNTAVTFDPLIPLNTESKVYYTNRGNLPDPNTKRQLNISYNVFKSPYEIEEIGIDKISFTYNDNNDRSAMFYGSLDATILPKDRPNRKFYSADGTMEIKITPSATEFITYIGGDAYSAPIIVKSNGVTQNYLYLHRDYQGSILAITDANAAVLEKRLFDAWGSLIAVQNGAGVALTGLTVLDRGYTGHEHLQSVGLINMNGRIYDAKLHRFLQPDNYIQDPFDTQNYNRYSYVLNNPLKYTDPSGESAAGIFGFLFSLWVHGSYASGGELNPLKWNSNGLINAGLAVGSPIASIGATNYVNGYMENYDKPLQIGITATSGANGGGSDFAIINTSSSHWYTVDWSRVGTRVVGALQMVGGTVETIVGGVGGVATAETGVGAVLGYAVAMNGIDNATAGAIQLWTGESQNTLLHKGVSATAVYAGASYDTAERVATYADISTMALGGFASYKSVSSWRAIKVNTLRAAYETEVKSLSSIASEMRSTGSSSEEIARNLHSLRRQLGITYKSLTPNNILQKIYQRNLQKYGDKLGPTIDYLRQQGKSWDDIIESATRPGGKDLGF